VTAEIRSSELGSARRESHLRRLRRFLEPPDLRRECDAALLRYPVIAALFTLPNGMLIGARELGDEFRTSELVERTVQRRGPQMQGTIGLLEDVAHDVEPMSIGIRQGYEDVEPVSFEGRERAGGHMRIVFLDTIARNTGSASHPEATGASESSGDVRGSESS